MATDPRLETAPEPAGPDGDAKEPTAEVVAGAFIDDVVVEKQNDALDALLARDRELAAATGTRPTEATAAEAVAAPAAAPAAAPEPKATKTQEWTAALVIMVLIAAVCFALVSFFRQ